MPYSQNKIEYFFSLGPRPMLNQLIETLGLEAFHGQAKCLGFNYIDMSRPTLFTLKVGYCC